MLDTERFMEYVLRRMRRLVREEFLDNLTAILSKVRFLKKPSTLKRMTMASSVTSKLPVALQFCGMRAFPEDSKTVVVSGTILRCRR